jgi:hypothetical protein
VSTRQSRSGKQQSTNKFICGKPHKEKLEMATKLTPKQRDTATAWAAEKFKEQTPEYYPHPANSAKLLDFITEQLGAEYLETYPLSVENFSAAFEHVNREYIMIQRPEGQDSIAARQREEQKQVDADNRLIQHAEKVGEWVTEQERILKNMPMNDLRPLAAQQREGVKRGEIERTTYRNNPASRVVNVSDRAAARTRVAAKYPSMNRNSHEFSELVLQEMNS